MNTSSESEIGPTVSGQSTATLDRTLTEIRSGRRLEKIVESIESFLQSQISRLNTAMEKCQQAEDNDNILQGILADHEQEKLAWEEKRQTEVFRLKEASEQLILSWQQLEDERRSWLDERNNPR